MAKTITTKYGTKINVDGLSPEQVKKVRSVAEDNGSYGLKGSALADTFRKKAGGGKIGIPRGENPKKGAGEVDVNMETFLDQAFADLGEIDMTGAPKVLTGEDLASSRKSVYDSILGQQTKGLETSRARDLEAQKQELAERGIPINFGDPNDPKADLYTKSIGAVNSRYDTLNQDAANAANTGADNSLAALTATNKTAYDSFLQGVTTKYGSKLDAITAGLGKYGLDQQAAEAAKDRALQKHLAKLQMQGRGGGSSGGGGSDSTTPIIGGVAPGFGV
ncbi:hypothetical protein UFOVP591_18 [uncultured Caudovirales phage]|uniref:Uncharacterized protein n=1 Tax=uncultured Caudovirales phage TaxID=2100421 RepID=A0A6J5N014_9CAUD|nr:hypothetical protein UFOVP591_18 [uncultured Caudovirales phage]